MDKINAFIEVGKDGLVAVCTKSNKYNYMILDTESFLRYYGNILTPTGLQKITGVHYKQLSHYATGQSRPTAKTVRRIQEGISRFADTLKQVRLV